MIRRRSGKLRYWSYVIPFAIAYPFVMLIDVVRWSSPGEGKVVVGGLALVILGVICSYVWMLVFGILVAVIAATLLAISKRPVSYREQGRG